MLAAAFTALLAIDHTKKYAGAPKTHKTSKAAKQLVISLHIFFLLLPPLSYLSFMSPKMLDPS